MRKTKYKNFDYFVRCFIEYCTTSSEKDKEIFANELDVIWYNCGKNHNKDIYYRIIDSMED